MDGFEIGLGLDTKFSKSFPNVLHYGVPSAFGVEPSKKRTNSFCLGLFAFPKLLCYF